MNISQLNTGNKHPYCYLNVKNNCEKRECLLRTTQGKNLKTRIALGQSVVNYLPIKTLLLGKGTFFTILK